MDFGHGANWQLYRWINHIARDTPWLHGAATAYAGTAAIGLFAVLLLAGLFLVRHDSNVRLAKAGWAGLGMLAALAINQPIVHAVNEPRPYATHPGVLVLASHSTDPSFPSDHATMAGACVIGILLYHRKLGVTALVAAVALLVGRVYIGAHYPLDVLAGFVVGGLIAGFGWWLLRPPLTWLTTTLRSLPGIRSLFAPAAPSTVRSMAGQ